MMNVSRVFACAALLALAAGLSKPPASVAGTSDSELELQRIKREMSAQKKVIKRADKKERSVLVELDAIEREIQTDGVELTNQQKLLLEAEQSLQDIQKNSAELTRELERERSAYGLRVRALYKMKRNRATPLLAADSLGSAIKQVRYLGIIAARDRIIIDEYGSTLHRLTLRQTEIAGKKSEILDRKRAVESKKSQFEKKRQRKAAILASVRREKGLYQQTLRELEESSTSLWAMIRKDALERKATPEAAPASFTRSVPHTVEKGRLPWPLDGQVLTRFGMQRHPVFGTMVFRRGIEIEAREGQSVRAVSDGEVAYADWYKGYGRLLIVDHGGGFYTLYGNLSRLDCAKGGHVTRGQVIGLAGETGSLKGPKLYFEVRQNGEALDPLSKLAKR